MRKIETVFFAIAITLMFALAPVWAQDTLPTLQVDSGSVMTSSGGEFETAQSGAMLQPGTRLMVAENSSATLVYPNGATIQFTAPGVYVVQAAPPAGTSVVAGVDMLAVGIVAGTVALGALGLSSMDEVEFVPPPPVSQ